MSSKKARRKERQQREQESRESQANPVRLFMLAIGVAVLLTIVAAIFFVDRSDRGEPPWPGAIWSPAHGHWH
jgi:hypothetical protein